MEKNIKILLKITDTSSTEDMTGWIYNITLIQKVNHSCFPTTDEWRVKHIDRDPFLSFFPLQGQPFWNSIDDGNNFKNTNL